jgi:CheY-like chemotaxis protein
VLDIARIEAGRLTLSPEPVELHATVREVLDLMGPLAAERRLRLTTTCAEDVEEYIVADRQRLKQVLLNLLSNAVKYNRDDGAITVSCRREGEDRVVIAVHDTGLGISAERLERLFTPFDRLGAEATAIEGTGLGLALSRRLMEAMEGRLEAETTPGTGSTFWIELPLATDPATTLSPAVGGPPEAVTAPASGARARTVLYIEDNLSNLQLVQRVLARRAAVSLLSAMQGRLGLDLAQQHRPDLILLDLHLPDMSGLEVLRRLQTDARTQATPVIVLTADASPGQLGRLLAAGAYAYLSKPLDVLRFLELVDDVLAGDGTEVPR